MRDEVIEKLSVLITSAFGLVAALAWNSAIQRIFELAFGDIAESGVLAMLVYAVAVTVIVVIAVVWLGKISQKLKKKK